MPAADVDIRAGRALRCRPPPRARHCAHRRMAIVHAGPLQIVGAQVEIILLLFSCLRSSSPKALTW